MEIRIVKRNAAVHSHPSLRWRKAGANRCRASRCNLASGGVCPGGAPNSAISGLGGNLDLLEMIVIYPPALALRRSQLVQCLITHSQDDWRALLLQRSNGVVIMQKTSLGGTRGGAERAGSFGRRLRCATPRTSRADGSTFKFPPE